MDVDMCDSLSRLWTVLNSEGGCRGAKVVTHNGRYAVNSVPQVGDFF
jgi:hypothetical protein